jgi:threonyl-tRNA synthetase
VISMVDGELWDLTRPLEKSCKLELLDFEHTEGKSRREKYKGLND